MMYVLCWCNCPVLKSPPLRLVYCRKDDGENSLHLQNWERAPIGIITLQKVGQKQMSMLIFADSFKSTAILFSIFFLSFLHPRFIRLLFFFCHRSWVSGLSFPPPLLLLPSWPLISCFLLSILTQDKCSLLRRFLLLKELTAHIVGHWHCFFPAYFQSSGLFLTYAEHEEMTDERFWSFTFSESSVTSTILDLHDFIQRFEWKPAYDASLRVMWHLKDPEICHYEWTPCVNVGHPCLISHFINGKVKAQYGYSWLSNQEPILPGLHKGLLWHFATLSHIFFTLSYICISFIIIKGMNS